MPWHYHGIGTPAALAVELANLDAPDTDLDTDQRAAAIDMIERCWDPTRGTVANTVLNGTLELTMHGNSDEKGMRLTVHCSVVKNVGAQVSTATLPNVTLGGATTYTP